MIWKEYDSDVISGFEVSNFGKNKRRLWEKGDSKKGIRWNPLINRWFRQSL